MPNLLPLQPRFNLFVSRPGKKQEYELTNYVQSVTLEVDQNQITYLNIEVNFPELHLEWIQKYYKIDFYGGYLDRDDYYVGEPGNYKFTSPNNQTNNFYRYMFNGHIRQIQVGYHEDGIKTLSVNCVDATWGATPAKYREYYAYPSKDCLRTWANKDTMTFEDIVKGMVETEMKVPLKLDLGAANHEYSTKRPAVQDGVSDWAFLRKLCKDNNCYLTTPVNDNNHTVQIMDKSKALNTIEKRFEFIWLDRIPGMPFDFKQGDHLQEGDAINESSKLKDNQIAFISVSVDESPAQELDGMAAVQITDFDEKTGTETQKLVAYDEDKDELIYYDLNDAKVKEMERTHPEETQRLLNMGPFNIPPDEFLKYYDTVRIPKATINAIDKPMLGVNVTGKVKGNVMIEPFQSYDIYGIARYSAFKKGKKGRYYLKGIVHTWNDEGFWTDLTFIS